MTETTLATASGRTATHTPGAFVWHELRVKDVAQAQQFYAALLGWTFQRAEMPSLEYYLIRLGDKEIGGLCSTEGMCDAQGNDLPAHFGAFISVPDVDQAAAAARAAGGQVVHGPDDVPGIGRFAMLVDPQGASVALYKDLKGDPDTSNTLVGEFCWDQLTTSDLAGAVTFYEKVVGWEAEWPMPGMGLFKYGERREASLGAAPQSVPSHWETYIQIADLVETTQKAERLGAKILVANQEAGPWGRFSLIQDPAGAIVSLFQGREH